MPHCRSYATSGLRWTRRKRLPACRTPLVRCLCRYPRSPVVVLNCPVGCGTAYARGCLAAWACCRGLHVTTPDIPVTDCPLYTHTHPHHPTPTPDMGVTLLPHTPPRPSATPPHLALPPTPHHYILYCFCCTFTHTPCAMPLVTCLTHTVALHGCVVHAFSPTLPLHTGLLPLLCPVASTTTPAPCP